MMTIVLVVGNLSKNNDADDIRAVDSVNTISAREHDHKR